MGNPGVTTRSSPGGAQASENAILDRDGVDGICIGEGEYATLDLLNALEKNGDGSTVRSTVARPRKAPS